MCGEWVKVGNDQSILRPTQFLKTHSSHRTSWPSGQQPYFVFGKSRVRFSIRRFYWFSSVPVCDCRNAQQRSSEIKQEKFWNLALYRNYITNNLLVVPAGQSAYTYIIFRGKPLSHTKFLYWACYYQFTLLVFLQCRTRRRFNTARI